MKRQITSLNYVSIGEEEERKKLEEEEEEKRSEGGGEEETWEAAVSQSVMSFL